MILRCTYILSILYLGLLWRVKCQTPPECFMKAVETDTITCDDVDLRGLDNGVYGRISGLQRSKIFSVQLTNCTVDNLDFLDSSYLDRVRYLYIDDILGLSNNHLSSLKSYVSRALEQLEITNNPLLTSVDSLIQTGFGSEWDNLETFRVQNNALRTVNPGLFKAINHASEYNFRGNSLRSLDLTEHNSVTSVRKLVLNSNLLTSISGLEEFTQLEELDLENNRLRDVNNFINNVLSSDKLKSFNLQNNLIESFNPIESSLEAPSALVIDLQNNRLTSISNLGQSIARNVQKLNLRDNAGLQITTDTFKSLNNLKDLDLSDCGITQITTHLQNLANLKILHLQENNLNLLSNETFSGTTSVEEIYLQNNELMNLDFLTSESITLPKLKKLDVSLNQLDNLVNFVSAPALQELRMDGAADRNDFSQLSSCLSFTEIPITLRIVCARNIRADTVDGCRYRSFLELLKNQKVIFNNNNCCDNPFCNEANSPSVYPATKTCPSKDVLCTLKPIEPGGTTTTQTPGAATTKGQCEIPKRLAFQDLHDSELIVMVVGYILALMFLVIVIILFLRRYRSYDKWLEDRHHREMAQPTGSLPLQVLRKSSETLDSIDGRMGNGSPKIGTNGTLQRQKVYPQKSFDNVSMASGFSQYSASNGKSPFQGRRKFSNGNSLDIEEQQGMRYTSQSQRPRLHSGEESPTAMSVYSYASHQPVRSQRSEADTSPVERRRHRSGGAVQRLNSGDLLDLVDEDILPPKIQVVLQRKATEKRNQAAVSPIARNSRPYGTAPYRTKGKSGIVKKKTHSPLLTVTNRVHRRSGGPTPTMIKRALPDLPVDSVGSVSSSLKSASSVTSDNSKLSSSSLLKNNGAFSMDAEVEDSEYHETEIDIIGLG